MSAFRTQPVKRRGGTLPMVGWAFAWVGATGAISGWSAMRHAPALEQLIRDDVLVSIEPLGVDSVDVTVQDHRAVLSGVTATKAEHQALIQAARDSLAIREVDDRMTVRGPAPTVATLELVSELKPESESTVVAAAGVDDDVDATMPVPDVAEAEHQDGLPDDGRVDSAPPESISPAERVAEAGRSDDVALVDPAVDPLGDPTVDAIDDPDPIDDVVDKTIGQSAGAEIDTTAFDHDDFPDGNFPDEEFFDDDSVDVAPDATELAPDVDVALAEPAEDPMSDLDVAMTETQEAPMSDLDVARAETAEVAMSDLEVAMAETAEDPNVYLAPDAVREEADVDEETPLANAKAAVLARPSLTLALADRVLTIDGSLASSADSLALVDAAMTAFDLDAVSNSVDAEANVAAADWLDSLTVLLPELATLDDPGVAIVDRQITLSGTAPDGSTRDAVVESALERLGDYSLVERIDVDETVATEEKVGDTIQLARLHATSDPSPVADRIEAAAPSARTLREAWQQLPETRIPFEPNSNQLAPDSLRVLDRMADLLLAHPNVHIEIEGHTDATGDRDANLRLSQLRANAVRDHLVSRGVEYDQLTAYGYGEGLPVADNRTRKGRAANRRIEFTF